MPQFYAAATSYPGVVTRIVAGAAKSVRLEVPSSGTRPTSDRVREALFSGLEALDALKGARILDLYAGSGALGFEALSRGAQHVTLVDSSPVAARLCRSNAIRVMEAAGIPSSTTVKQKTVTSFLSTATSRWDLVFIDPPYDLDEPELSIVLRHLGTLVNANGIVVVERSKRSDEPTWPTMLERFRLKNYGETSMWFAERISAPEHS